MKTKEEGQQAFHNAGAPGLLVEPLNKNWNHRLTQSKRIQQLQYLQTCGISWVISLFYFLNKQTLNKHRYQEILFVGHVMLITLCLFRQLSLDLYMRLEFCILCSYYSYGF